MRVPVILSFLLLAACASAPPQTCVPLRDDDGHGRISRSRDAVRSFRASHPCPATQSTIGPCPGYVVDHIEPLCNCGADAPANMQWQTAREAQLKDKWEVALCRRNARRSAI